jgi:hypothetical protein
VRGKIRRIEEALDCSFFTSEHTGVLAMMLAAIDHYTTQIEQLTARIEVLTEPWMHQAGQLDEIDGTTPPPAPSCPSTPSSKPATPPRW